RWETYRTQKEAKVALGKRLEELRKGTYHAPTEMPTLREVAEAWLVRKADRRPGTVAGWESHVWGHIVPAIGDYRVDQVSARRVEERLRNAIRERLEARTVNKVLGTLTSILDHAAREGYVERNAGRLAERLKVAAEEITTDESEAPAPAAPDKEVN